MVAQSENAVQVSRQGEQHERQSF